MQPNNDLPYL